MGLIISRFKKQKTTKETLLQMEEDIDKLVSTQKRNHELQNSIVLFFLTLSFSVYMLAAVVFYVWYFPDGWMQRLVYLLPFVAFPFLVFFLRSVLHYVFITRISKNARRVDELKREKKKILENVMETETYKVAKELLERFDPTRKLVEQNSSPKSVVMVTPGQELRKRTVPATPIVQGRSPSSRSPETNGTPQIISQMSSPQTFVSPQRVIPHQQQTPAPKHPSIQNAPILPRERSVFDKVAEYFVGDGPSNRFALICRQCFSHNGMALTEEFQFISYKCCYCNHFNPARKQRLNAPSLERTLSDSSSTKHVNDGSSDENERKEDEEEHVLVSDENETNRQEGVERILASNENEPNQVEELKENEEEKNES